MNQTDRLLFVHLFPLHDPADPGRNRGQEPKVDHPRDVPEQDLAPATDDHRIPAAGKIINNGLDRVKESTALDLPGDPEGGLLFIKFLDLGHGKTAIHERFFNFFLIQILILKLGGNGPGDFRPQASGLPGYGNDSHFHSSFRVTGFHFLQKK